MFTDFCTVATSLRHHPNLGNADMSSPPGGNAGAPADSLCDRNVHDPATLRDVQCTPSNERFASLRSWEVPTCRALLEAMLEAPAIPSLTEEAKSQG